MEASARLSTDTAWLVLAKGTTGGDAPLRADCRLLHGTTVLDRSAGSAATGTNPNVPVTLTDVAALPSGGRVALECNVFPTTFLAHIKLTATAVTVS